MPKVGDEEFAYTPEGKAKAKQKSLETGEPVMPKYDAGGRVKKIKGYAYGGPVTPVAPVAPMAPVAPVDTGNTSDITLPSVEPINPISPAYKKGGKVKKK